LTRRHRAPLNRATFERSYRALVAPDAHADVTDGEPATALTDILADLMPYGRPHGESFQQARCTAESNFRNEVDPTR
jgi:hypothetical protein